MKIFFSLLLAMAALPAHAQLYKWTDAGGKVHYFDRPQDGADNKPVQAQQTQAAPAAANDNWRERERQSRESRQKAEANERRASMAKASASAQRQPFNPTRNFSDKPMTEDEACTRDQQQIEFAEKTRNFAIGHGNSKPVPLTETQRQEVIAERKANHAIACGRAARR